ncbi:hypothetical protein PPL_03686 [Heterostelium album PN500]|uniref:Uncharacterized protein n=1 Tax=Heterostelium pallidum (strain ATCC 26659 / Pp 5 / PN500) TaxID=670386 RepID=D3B6D8_HETP5|nr:hypothetical protein PPL_03686 [Heterostelium album PN500]EFA82908.1 hypothetical protein PPL_03686 [Heterostelium album PN500]|eukprot:XP_020435025.1 hypothetical protein PPL_03686 [Heterostelium album PN500]
MKEEKSFQFIDKFTTTWITVADGSGTYLNHIEFTFYYSNDKIVDVKYKLDYNDEEIHRGKKPEHFYLIYKWQQVRDKDYTMSLFVLFFTGIALGGFVFTYNAFRFQLEFGSTTATKKRKEELPSYVGYNTNNDWKTYSDINNNSNNNNTNFNKNNEAFKSPRSNDAYDISNSNNSIPTMTVNQNINSNMESGGNFGFEAVDDSELVNFDHSPNLPSSSPTTTPTSPQHNKFNINKNSYPDNDKDK